VKRRDTDAVAVDVLDDGKGGGESSDGGFRDRWVVGMTCRWSADATLFV
jgi:hypothetical protein